MFLNQLLARQRHNNKTAISMGQRAITYSAWYNEALKISKLLGENAFSQNTAIFLPNSIEYALAYFGILASQRRIVPIGIQSKGLEIKGTIDYCEVNTILTSLDRRDFLLECLSDYSHAVTLLYMDDYSAEVVHPEKPRRFEPETAVSFQDEDDTVILLHTSGTTSNPKRVMLTHSNLLHNIESNIASLAFTEKDVVLIALPMFFGYCNTAQFLTAVYLGAKMVIMEGLFSPKAFFATVACEHVTYFTAVPAMLLMLLEYRYYSNYDISSLRYVCFGGGKTPADAQKRLVERFPTVGFVQTYGQTEASPRVTALLPRDFIRKAGSVGTVIPNVKIKILDENDTEVKPFEIGQIAVFGKNVMKGYFKQEEITKATLKNGWLHTGDLGYVDEEGYLYLTGRKKNMLISGGINVYPEEIEEVLLQCPVVKDACVTAQEHKILGEVPVAKIVLRDGTKSPPDFEAYCKDRLAQYKVPVRFDVVDHLDKTYNGKTRRF